MRDLFSLVNTLKNQKIIFDFNRIKFISRACADEYIKQKRLSKKMITEINQTEDIKKLFAAVMKTQNRNPEISVDKPQIINT
jgi:urease alpha subunit